MPTKLRDRTKRQASRVVKRRAAVRVTVANALADDAPTAFIDDFNKREVPPAATTGPATLRAATDKRTAERPPGPELHAVSDILVAAGGPLVRVYRPSENKTGVLVYFHGGGWVIGDLESHDRACRRLAASSGAVVVAVDYRRAPEHPWPAAVDDAIRVMRWAHHQPVELGSVNGRIGVGATVPADCSLR